MTATNTSDSSCKESTERIGDKTETDSPVNRRSFLGAAAALSALPAIGGGEVAASASSERDGSPEGQVSEHGCTTVAKTVGGLQVYTDGNYETQVKVTSYPEGISIDLVNELGSMNALLLPEDIEPLCRKLLDARAKTQPEEVEDSRKWMTGDFRDGGA